MRRREDLPEPVVPADTDPGLGPEPAPPPPSVDRYNPPIGNPEFAALLKGLNASRAPHPEPKVVATTDGELTAQWAGDAREAPVPYPTPEPVPHVLLNCTEEKPVAAVLGRDGDRGGREDASRRGAAPVVDQMLVETDPGPGDERVAPLPVTSELGEAKIDQTREQKVIPGQERAFGHRYWVAGVGVAFAVVVIAVACLFGRTVPVAASTPPPQAAPTATAPPVVATSVEKPEAPLPPESPHVDSPARAPETNAAPPSVSKSATAVPRPATPPMPRARPAPRTSPERPRPEPIDPTTVFLPDHP